MNEKKQYYPRLKVPLFPLGEVFATQRVLSEIKEVAGQDPADFLGYHVLGDFGDICKEDQELNLIAIENDDRIISKYTLNNGTEILIETQWDRSTTTILLASEY